MAGGATSIVGGVAAVDCHKQVRSWRLLRSLVQLLMLPCCNAAKAFMEAQEDDEEEHQHKSEARIYPSFSTISTTIVNGMIFGYRRGRASYFCIQTPSLASKSLNGNDCSKSNKTFFLFQFGIPTAVLAQEMRGGTLRIELVASSNVGAGGVEALPYYYSPLVSTPIWTMYCNGRKAGFALSRERPTEVEAELLRQTESAIEGAGIINCKHDNAEDDKLMYLRAKFKRVGGLGAGFESFHLIDPEGISRGQELSIFLICPS